MRAFVILFSIFIIFPLSTFAQTDLDELLAPIDFLEDQQYILEIKQIETTQEQSSFNEYGYVIRRIDDEAGKPASLHFSLDTTRKSFDVVPGVRNDISPTIMNVTTSDSTGYQLVATLSQELQTVSGFTIPITYALDGTKLGLTVFPDTNQPLGAYNATIQVIALPW